ncbi:uncharacterized protein DNG_08964 [Cephalotrichum gorgonifer]|uniref:HET domain-containing protein n=1 Tax=Cephalotrichum gorgonifer TaxID=2041049 RepID=A0AAE8N4V2_9PEZI|nr:uncharacterized protein DNG_08964 [Cephalotrichum gorgonifer]
MHLLNIETLHLESFTTETTAPPFAILSHTWGEGEVTLQDLSLPHKTLSSRPGWQKITRFRDAVTHHPHLLSEPVSHLWVDTCCIDKTSSAELSEAINSMFRWYRHATCCFALLGDVTAMRGDGAEEGGRVGADFEASRWFTRGWTLQELLAPSDVHFFDRHWDWIGSKTTLAERISARTSIDEGIILSGEWPFASVAQRMSWMSGRVTTRVEDMAYCLLGIFDVHMPMLYGEGERAFVRLQEEIIKDSDDQSILAWDASGSPDSSQAVGAFATHPRQFRNGGSVECLPTSHAGPFALTNKGLQIDLPIIEHQDSPGQKIVLLSCSDVRDVTTVIGIKVQPDATASSRYTRLPAPPITIPLQDHTILRQPSPTIYLAKRDQPSGRHTGTLKCLLYGPSPGRAFKGVEFIGASPPGVWNVNKIHTMTMLVPRDGVDDQGEVTTVLLFQLGDEEGTFCLILSILPTVGTARVGLLLGPDKAPEGEMLDKMLERLRRSASSIIKSTWAELVLKKGKVYVKVGIGPAPSVIGVSMSRLPE